MSLVLQRGSCARGKMFVHWAKGYQPYSHYVYQYVFEQDIETPVAHNALASIVVRFPHKAH